MQHVDVSTAEFKKDVSGVVQVVGEDQVLQAEQPNDVEPHNVAVNSASGLSPLKPACFVLPIVFAL